MMLSLQKYEISVNYKPGKTLFIADTLSRAPGSETGKDQDETLYVHTLGNLPVAPQKIEEFEVATANDEALQKLKQAVKIGWPEKKHSVDPAIHEYWSIRDEISEQCGILLRGERLIVPKELRVEMLKKIHENHLGVEKCKRRARDVLYWPGMNDQIAQMVAKCETCARYKKSPHKEPMKPHDVPERPWQKIGMDLMEFEKENYIVLTDYYSKFFEVSKLPNTSAATTVKYIKPHFARHGIPEEVISDNGPQFSAKEFQEFAEKYEFKHTTSSPKYPQSNGLAERTIQTLKGILKKAKYDGTDPNLAILDFRNTPIEGIGMSPAQVLMGRRTRTLLPTNNTLLQPFYNTKKIKPTLEQIQLKQKTYYDRSTKPLPSFKVGDKVGIKNDQKGAWIPATVKKVCDQPRSYVVESNGGEYRRNRRDLIKHPDNPKCEATGSIPATPLVSENRPIIPQTQQEGNITRSGRIIKPPARLGFNE